MPKRYQPTGDKTITFFFFFFYVRSHIFCAWAQINFYILEEEIFHIHKARFKCHFLYDRGQ